MSREVTPIVQQLRARGMRVTAARSAVLEWLADYPHATVEQVHEGVSQRIGSLSKQAVYDVLNAFIDADLVQQIKPAGHPARFERRTGDNHHHLVCRSCGRIEDVDCAIGATPCLTPDHDHGFDIDEAEVMYWGVCKACRTAAVTSDDDH
jgi:Fur family ferric uptake transcriptional regulator